MFYTVADPTTVSARCFEDEVVIANFATGLYFSLLGSAAEIWRGLMASHAVGDVAATLARDAAGPPQAFAATVDDFVHELQRAGLIQPAPGGAPAPWLPVPSEGGWSPPQLDSFSDMQDLLLLDPVHDTSDAGWPYVVRP